jgi:hypothetical protein
MRWNLIAGACAVGIGLIWLRLDLPPHIWWAPWAFLLGGACLLLAELIRERIGG